MWDKETLAYAAGFLDGEGCFIAERGSKAYVSMSNTYKPVVEWFVQQFGGSISKGMKRKPHHKLIYTWVLSGKNIDTFLPSIIPYLKQKAPQASLLLFIRATNTYPKVNRKVDPLIIEERMRLGCILKELKHVEY